MKSKYRLSSLLFFLLFFGCEEKTGDGSDPNIIGKLTGVIQKGPFIQDSEVRMVVLDKQLNSNSLVFFNRTTDDLGSFELSANIPPGYVELSTSGYYFNEVEGRLSASPINLRSLGYYNGDESHNINILTTLAFDRFKYPITNENKSYDEARYQSSAEVLAAFDITVPSSEGIGFAHLDFSLEGDHNAILLAVTSIVQWGRSEAKLSELIGKIANDLEPDGTIDGNLKYSIKEQGKKVSSIQVLGYLRQRYDDLGLDVYPEDFFGYLDTDADGVLNKDDEPTSTTNAPFLAYQLASMTKI